METSPGISLEISSKFPSKSSIRDTCIDFKRFLQGYFSLISPEILWWISFDIFPRFLQLFPPGLFHSLIMGSSWVYFRKFQLESSSEILSGISSETPLLIVPGIPLGFLPEFFQDSSMDFYQDCIRDHHQEFLQDSSWVYSWDSFRYFCLVSFVDSFQSSLIES